MVATKKALKRKGAAMVEYAILVGAVALIGILGMSVLGRKATDIVSTLAVILPGANTNEDMKLHNASLIELTQDGTTFKFDSAHINDGTAEARLGMNTGLYQSSSNDVFILPQW